MTNPATLPFGKTAIPLAGTPGSYEMLGANASKAPKKWGQIHTIPVQQPIAAWSLVMRPAATAAPREGVDIMDMVKNIDVYTGFLGLVFFVLGFLGIVLGAIISNDIIFLNSSLVAAIGSALFGAAVIMQD